MSTHAESLPKGLVAGVLVLTLVVLALGGAVVAIRLRPEPLPENSIDRSVVQWQQTVDDNPKDSRAYTGLGLALLDADRTAEAQEAFRQAISLDESAWLAKFQMGLLVADTDPDRALELFASAAKLAPDQEAVAPLIASGDLLLELGEPARARDAYKRSLAVNPFVIDGHYGLGAAYEDLGQEKAALSEYREAARFDPNNEAVAEAIERLGG